MVPDRPSDVGRRRLSGVRADGRHVAQDLRPVAPDPVERRVRERVHVVPRELLREEVRHAAPAHELREGGAVPKAVREPGGLARDAEAGAEVALAEYHLACQGLSGGHVGVVLDLVAMQE